MTWTVHVLMMTLLGLIAFAAYIGLQKGSQGLGQGESTLARWTVLGGGDNEVAKGGHKGWHSYGLMKTKSFTCWPRPNALCSPVSPPRVWRTCQSPNSTITPFLFRSSLTFNGARLPLL